MTICLINCHSFDKTTDEINQIDEHNLILQFMRKARGNLYLHTVNTFFYNLNIVKIKSRGQCSIISSYSV